jgi:NADH-quinone oxidoreductase subunit N
MPDFSLLFGFLFVLIALLFKVGAAPFHSWLCDVYEGSIISVTFLFAAVPKIVLFNLIIKIFLLVFSDFSIIWSSFFLFASVLSIVIGSVSALYQKRLKRLFAYSTISHTGFILLGVACLSVDSTSSLIFYVVVYSGLTILLFSLLIFSIITQENFPAFIANWTSSGLRNYVFIISFTLVLFSIAGIPPLAGFFSKLMVLLSLIAKQHYITSLVIVIVSSIASFYYIRLIKTFFFVKTSKNNLWISSTKRHCGELSVGIFFFLNLTFCFYPEFLSLVSGTLSLVLF